MSLLSFSEVWYDPYTNKKGASAYNNQYKNQYMY